MSKHRIWYMEGVRGPMSVKMRKATGIIARMEARRGYDTFITSIQDGTHMFGSLHPDGNAVDFLPLQTSIITVKAALGPDYDVVRESDHDHIEYDPKPPRKEFQQIK